MPSLPWSTLQGKHSLSRLDQREEMRLGLWFSNYKYPEKDQKTLPVLLQSRGKMATAEELLRSHVSCLRTEDRFYSFLQPSQANPSYLEFVQEESEFYPEGIRKHYRFNIWDRMSLYCFQMFLFKLFSLHCGQLISPHIVQRRREFHTPISFIKPLLKLYQFRNTVCQLYFILCFKHAHHKCGLRQVL